jgi:hypothetical protein
MNLHHPLMSIIALFILMSITPSCSACGYDEVIRGQQIELWSMEIGQPEMQLIHTWPMDVSYDYSGFRTTLLGYDPYRLLLYYSTAPFGRGTHVIQLDLRTSEIITLQPDPGVSSLFVLSPDGNRFTYEKLAKVWITNVDGSSRRAIPDHPEIPDSRNPRWHASGSAVVFWSSTGLWMYTLEGSTYQRLMNNPPWTYSVSADSRWVAYESTLPQERTKIRLLNVESGDVTVIREGWQPRFVNADTEILFHAADGTFVADRNGGIRKFYGGQQTKAYVSGSGRYVGTTSSYGLTVTDMTSGDVPNAFFENHPRFQPESIFNWQAHWLRIPAMFFTRDDSKFYFFIEHSYSNDGC